jgi:SAM-dependent methyltransferase
MPTPWLEIPLEDYEGHMDLPSVAQAKMLADQLQRLIERQTPASIAILGCAGGNGLDHIDPTGVDRVVAVDINPHYVLEAERRYAKRLTNLDIRCADVQSDQLQFGPVQLIYAGLLFEYVDVRATLATCQRNLQRGGSLAVLLQRPHPEQKTVSRSPYRSLDKLASALHLIEPEMKGP